MNCSDFQTLWHDWHAGELQGMAAKRVQRHLQSCPVCRAWQADMRQLLQELRTMPAPDLAPKAADRLLRSVQPISGRTWRARGALAASLVLAMAAGALLSWPIAPPTAAVAVTAVPVQTLQIVVTSPRDLQDVVFTIELPPGVTIDGYPGQRVLSWRGELSAGDNGLTLPLIGDTEGELVTRVEHAGLQKEVRVPLETQPARA